MLPVLFRFRGIEIRSYPALLFVGLTLGIIAGTKAGVARGLNEIPLYTALLILTIPALVGARLLYVLVHWPFYRQRPSEIWSGYAEGAAHYGGLLLAFACSWPVLRILGLPFGEFWDAAAITLLVAVGVGKIGCLLNGCCAGRATSGWLAFNLPNSHGVRHRRFPSQLMEGALAAVLALIGQFWTTRPFAGAFFLSALAIYAAARIPLSAMRETVDRISGVSVLQALSAILLITSIAGLAAFW